VKRLLGAAVFMMAMAAGASDSPRALLREGLSSYGKKDYEKAADQFDRAAGGAATNRLDPAVPLFNAANSLMQLGRHEEASPRYQEALRSPDLALQGQAYYNRGNALYRMAEPSAAPPMPAPQASGAGAGAQAIEEALRMYERALFLNPGDEDAKVNYELALRLKEQIQQQQQQQQQQKDQQQEQQQQDEQKDQEQKKDQEKEDQPQEQQQDQAQDEQQPQEEPSKQEPTPAEQMTPEEARMLLDRMKQEEQSYRDQLRVIIGRPVPVDKDW